MSSVLKSNHSDFYVM